MSIKIKFGSRKGFTLIEMLVVIAVIGILSAAVLTALSPARNKAKDARIISDLQEMRSVAETLYNGTYANVFTSPQNQPIVDAQADVTKNGGTATYDLDSTQTSFRAYSQLNSKNYYCVDSAGFAGDVGASATFGSAGKCQ